MFEGLQHKYLLVVEKGWPYMQINNYSIFYPFLVKLNLEFGEKPGFGDGSFVIPNLINL